MAAIGWRTGTVRLLAAVLVGAAAGPVALAQENPLDRAKALRDVAEQKTESDVQAAIQEAEKLARYNAPAAAKRLKDRLLAVNLSTDISETKRDQLSKLLETKIAALEGKPVPDPKAQKKKDEQRKVEEAYRLETKDVRETVAEVEKLYELNKVAEAQAKVAMLARKYPNNPSVLFLTGQGSVADKVAVAKELAREQGERFLYAMNDVQRSALPPKGDIEFPKNWKELTERRRKLLEVKLSPEEESILQALGKKVDKELRDAPFEETVQQLSNLIDKPIYLDKKSLEDTGVDLRRPVTMPGGVTARTALRAVLQSQGLTYIVKDKVIQVVTLEKAKETLVTRAYYLGDVIAAVPPFGGGATWGPLVDYQSMMQNAKLITESIMQSVDPLIWNTPTNRGPATIIFHPPSMSLIVRAPAEVHAALSSKLR